MTAQSKFAINLLLLAIFLFLQCRGAVANAQTLYRVTIQQGVSVKMRDGVSLVADVNAIGERTSEDLS